MNFLEKMTNYTMLTCFISIVFFDSFSEFKERDKVRVWGRGGANEFYPPQCLDFDSSINGSDDLEGLRSFLFYYLKWNYIYIS